MNTKRFKTIDATGEGCDAILLGYGLCSNGHDGIAARGTKLVIVKGHDCITHFLGSRSRYRQYFDEHPGTYWYTPGWIENHLAPGQERYDKTYRQGVEKYGEAVLRAVPAPPAHGKETSA